MAGNLSTAGGTGLGGARTVVPKQDIAGLLSPKKIVGNDLGALTLSLPSPCPLWFA